MSGVRLPSGGTYHNPGTITGDSYGVEIYGAVGALYNSGAITAAGPLGVGVYLGDGGTVTNFKTGTISGGNIGVWISQASGTVTNAGAIRGTAFGGTGVYLQDGGTVINHVGGSINGGSSGLGVAINGAAGTVINVGAISAVGFTGVSLGDGGTVTNEARATISGGADGAGIAIGVAAGSVTNAGQITGGTASVQFTGSGANTLTLQTGSVLKGDALGSTAAGATNALVLTGAGTANNAFENFDTLNEQASGSWTLGGNSTIGATTLSSGALIVAGALTTAVTQKASAAVTIDADDKLTLEGTSALHGAIRGAGTLSLASGSTTIGSGGTISVADLSITGAGTSAGIGEALGYAGVFHAEAGSLLAIFADDALTLTGATSFAGTISGLGTLHLAGGATTVASGAEIAVADWSITGATTVVTLDEVVGFSGAFAEAAGATVALSGGNLLLTGSALFSDSEVDGAHLLITEGPTHVSDLTIGGTVYWTNTETAIQSGDLMLGDSSGAMALLINKSTGTYDITNTSDILLGASKASEIRNSGLFEKTESTGISTVAASIVNSGTILAASGTLDLQGELTGPGAAEVDSGATLEVDGTVGVHAIFDYSGSGGDLELTDVVSGGSQLFHGTISGFGAGDELDIGAPFATITSYSFKEDPGGTSGTLTFADGSTHASIQFLGSYAKGNFDPQSDLKGGTLFTWQS